MPFATIYVVALSYFFYIVSISNLENSYEENQISKGETLSKLFVDYKKNALKYSVLVAQNPAVRDLFSNPDNLMLTQNLKTISKNILEYLGNNTKEFNISFYKYPDSLLLNFGKSDNFKIKDNDFTTLLKNENKAISLVEFSTDGFLLSGISLINNMQGLCKVSYNISLPAGLISNSKIENDYITLVNADFAGEFINNNNLNLLYPNKSENYYISESQKSWLKKNEIITKELVNKISNTSDIIGGKIGNIYYVFVPLFDFTNTKIGSIGYFANYENQLLDKKKEIYLDIALIALLVILFIGGIVIFIEYFIIRPMRKATLIAQEIAKGNITNLKI
jgi:hypothetical protein